MRYRDRLYLVFEELQTATLADVRAAEASLGARFPDGYAEYVTELGAGTYSHALRVALPNAKLVEWTHWLRDFLAKDFFWSEAGPFLPAQVSELVAVGNTWDGDELVSLASRPDELFVLPRHQDRSYRAGSGLDAALNWFCTSGALSIAAKVPYFEPDGEREEIEVGLHLPYESVRDAVVELGIHDLVAYEERREDRENIYTTAITTSEGDRWEVDDCRERSIKLLIKEFGGDIAVSDEPMEQYETTSVAIEYVAGDYSPNLDRLRNLLEELQSRERRKRRRK